MSVCVGVLGEHAGEGRAVVCVCACLGKSVGGGCAGLKAFTAFSICFRGVHHTHGVCGGEAGKVQDQVIERGSLDPFFPQMGILGVKWGWGRGRSGPSNNGRP